jgi:DNA processing protein
MDDELVYRIALTLIPNIGPVQARILIDHFGNAPDVFGAGKEELGRLEGIGEIRARSIRSFRDFEKAAAEIGFLKKYQIRPLFITDPDYPKRLLNCYDPPTLLYYKGCADLNRSRIISVIGTRTNSEYGKRTTEKLITDLAKYDTMIVSGLAFGIDAIAHKMALKHELSTVGVLAHGLHTIYPEQHTTLAKDLIKNGGLLSEFESQAKPDRHHFPTRNRIVAGMSDAVIVIETGVRGGSMITAELGNGYNRDVFAFPGRATDAKSAGCNHLIKTNKAILLTDAAQLAETMGWEDSNKKPQQHQKELFIELNDDERPIYHLLQQEEILHIDELSLRSGMSASKIAAAILNLELKNTIVSLPGKRYRLL